MLAEFWADGPDSETPPGHWFTIINYVHDHPQFERKMAGQGAVLDDLEWDVKAYFALSGALHDVAVSAWGIKGYYDYIRPISAIRYLASKGQSSDPDKASYSPLGMHLVPGYAELIEEGDGLAGINNEHIGKVKLKAWKGHVIIENPDTDHAGVDWIRAETWTPYQRQTFVTPPFAGYLSGHSTFSRAAAEVLALLTGSEYFPGGMGEFEAPKDEFLVFENGPSESLTLQWAKYADAADQCSLSRIWGGIHPPIDDIRGSEIGYEIGHEAFDFATTYFNGEVLAARPVKEVAKLYPNPANEVVHLSLPSGDFSKLGIKIIDVSGKQHHASLVNKNDGIVSFDISQLKSGVYFVNWSDSEEAIRFIKK